MTAQTMEKEDVAHRLEDRLETMDASLRSQLRSGDGSINSALLQQSLLRALAAVDTEHRALTAAWRAPISLFDEPAKRKAAQNGVPNWAIIIVCRVQHLVDDVSTLRFLVDNYHARINHGKREGRGVAREPLVKLFDNLDSLAGQLKAELVQLQAARAAFDAPVDAPLECPFALIASSNEASANSKLSDELHPILAPPAAHQRLWRSVMEAGRKVKNKATPSAEMQAAVSARLEAAGQSSRSLVRGALDKASRLGEGLASLQEGNFNIRQGVNESPSQCMKWDEVSGRPSSWINAEEFALMQSHIEIRLQLHESVSDVAQSRWERCRRGSDRRWSLP